MYVFYRSPSKTKKTKSFKFSSKTKDKREKKVEKDKDVDKKREKEKEKERKSDRSKEKTKCDKKDRKLKLSHDDKNNIEGIATRFKSETFPLNCVCFPEVLPVFGVSLQTAVERSRCHDGIELPLPIRDSIDYCQEHGMTVENIYKVNGIKSKVLHIKKLYNQREPVNFSDYDVPTATSLFKLFLR